MAFFAAHPEKAVLEAAAIQGCLEFPVEMPGQGFALLDLLVDQGRVVRLDSLIAKGLLGLMALVGGVAKWILAWRQDTDFTPTSVVLKSRTLKQLVLAWNI